MLHDLLALRGWWRLRHGFCPWCYSSPPHYGCSVCRGSHEYGAGMDPELRAAWRERWAVFLEGCR